MQDPAECPQLLIPWLETLKTSPDQALNMKGTFGNAVILLGPQHSDSSVSTGPTTCSAHLWRLPGLAPPPQQGPGGLWKQLGAQRGQVNEQL